MPLIKNQTITVNLRIPELKILTVEETEQQINIQVQRDCDYEVCPGCGHVSDKLHDQRWVWVRDLAIINKPVVLKLNRRRFRCLQGCKPFREDIWQIPKYQRRTKRYELELARACQKQSLQQAAHNTQVNYKLLERLYYRQAYGKALSITGQELPRVLGIDEFSNKRRGRMHMTFTDIENRKLWDVIEKKGAYEFMTFFKSWSREQRDLVEIITQDMDLGIRSWAKVMFPRAFFVADKFHVTSRLLLRLESVRKAAYVNSQSYENRKIIGASYWLIKHRHQDLNEEQEDQLGRLLKASQLLQEAYHLKEAFMAWYDRSQRKAVANRELDHLYDRFKAIKYMKAFCWILDNWREEIVNYFALPYTNAFTEGMNNKIKVLKRQAYGYRNFNNFRVRILNECAFT